MILTTGIARQGKAVEIPVDVQFHRQRLTRAFLQRRRQVAADVLQIAADIHFILGIATIRQLNRDFAVPRQAAFQRLADDIWQHIHPRRLPAGIEIHGHLIGFRAFGGGEVDIHRLIKPACGQRPAFEIAIHEAELAAQIVNRAIQRLDEQAVILQPDVAFGGGHGAVERDIQM